MIIIKYYLYLYNYNLKYCNIKSSIACTYAYVHIITAVGISLYFIHNNTYIAVCIIEIPNCLDLHITTYNL